MLVALVVRARLCGTSPALGLTCRLKPLPFDCRYMLFWRRYTGNVSTLRVFMLTSLSHGGVGEVVCSKLVHVGDGSWKSGSDYLFFCIRALFCAERALLSSLASRVCILNDN